MSAGSITIRKESLPARCEICHKSDEFDPVTGQCRRCESLVPPFSITVKKKRSSNPYINYSGVDSGPSALAIISMFIGVIAIVPGIFLGSLAAVLGVLAALLGWIELNSVRRRRAALVDEAFVKIAIYCGYGGILITLISFLFF
jgi:hypothetical protein